jgi:hypothetical protein
VPRPAGAPCDDGDACTAGDHCSGQGDTCLGGGPRECRGVCLTGACDAHAGCVPKPAGEPCDDGDPCTSPDHCAGDRAVCVPGSTACDDGDPCTAGDVCSGGVCRGTRVRGFDGAICRVRQRPLAALCTTDGGNLALDRFTSGRLHKAETLLERAATTPRIPLRNQLVRRSAGAVGEVAALAARYRRSGRIPRECAAATKQAVGELRRLILALLV